MTFTVVATTRRDGSVVLRNCETEREQRRAYQQALRTFRDGGFAEDVTGIELQTGEPGRANPEQTTGVRTSQAQFDLSQKD